MATLTENTPRAEMIGHNTEYPVIATDVIFQGAAVGENGSGYARPLEAGDPFLGFAVAKADNAAGVAGARNVTVRRKGSYRLTVEGATAITANDGAKVYASDDNTFTLTSTSNTLIGIVERWVASTDCVVYFDADFAALN